MLSIIDLENSNMASVCQAFRRLGACVQVTRVARDIGDADAIVLPGVGAFGDGMNSLRKGGLVSPIKDAAAAGTPLLGLCLGMQLFAEESDEYGRHSGLGIISGSVEKLPKAAGERVPNIGWSDTEPEEGRRLFLNTSASESFYFVHSYHMVCSDPKVVAATMQYGDRKIVAAVESGNVFGLQFHPEKSQDAGLSILDAFLSVVRERSGAIL